MDGPHLKEQFHKDSDDMMTNSEALDILDNYKTGDTYIDAFTQFMRNVLSYPPNY